MNAEQFHDALGMLPPDLIAETDALRTAPRQKNIPWKKWAALAACLVLVAGSTTVAFRHLLPAMGGTSMDAAAPQAPALAQNEEKSEYSVRATEARPESDLVSGSVDAPAENNLPLCQEAEETVLMPTGYPADGSYFVNLNAAQSILTYPTREDPLCIDSRQTTLFRTSAELEDYLRDWGEYYNLYAMEEACAAFDEIWFEGFDLLLIRVNTDKSELLPVIDSVTITAPDSWEIVICGPLLPEDNSPDPACWHILLPVEKSLVTENTVIHIEYP